MTLIKICGIKSEEAAQVAISNDSSLIGMIMVPGRERTVDSDVAKRIVKLASNERAQLKRKHQTIHTLIQELNSTKFSSIEDYHTKVATLLTENGPFAVGVFRNQSIDSVFEIADNLNLDIIQLHGSEDKVEFGLRNIKENFRYGIIPRFVIPNDIQHMETLFNARTEYGILLPLLDSEAGGEGKKIDWGSVGELKFGKYILAGGLNPENVHQALGVKNVIGVDVSGGVETNGVKDLRKVKQFIVNGRAFQRIAV